MGLSVQDVGAWNCNLSAAEFQLGTDGKTWALGSPDSYAWSGTSLTIKELRFETDPIIYGNILVQNNTAVNQIYTVGFSIPTTWAAPSLIRGSIDTSLIGTSATVSTVPLFSIYSAQIDFATVRTLQDNPFSLSTPQGAISASAAYGYEANAVPVTSNIGIQLRFQLSPGDTVAIISDFEIVAVPEPGTLAFLLLGGSVLVLRRQRR